MGSRNLTKTATMIFEVKEYKITTLLEGGYKLDLHSESHGVEGGDVVKRATTGNEFYVLGVKGKIITVVPKTGKFKWNILGSWSITKEKDDRL